MNALDWLIIALYLLFLLGIGAYLNLYQENTDDYFLAGQKMKWWQTGFSTMATQLSAVSFISAPAFVAITEGGGLRWLAYEVSVPLALIVVMVVIIPVLHRGRYISIQQYLSDRFDDKTRSLISGLFLLMRAFATGGIIVAGAEVLAATFAIDPIAAILVIGIVTIIYDVMGGIGVVIFSDVIQMAIIVIGITVCGVVASEIMNWSPAAVMDAYNASSRGKILIFDQWGFNKGENYGFWPWLFGGFFLYVAYYGCDQSQVQREMSVANEDDVRKSMLLNAFGRFPIVLLYCVVGLIIGAVFHTQGPEVVQRVQQFDTVAGLQRVLSENPDRMVPIFMKGFLPHGLIGLLFVAIMAALMSSLDSAINSLSAVTMQDFYRAYVRSDEEERHYLNAGKAFTVFWGVFITVMAVLMFQSKGATTVIELINQVGNMFYGPLSAVFLAGILTTWIRSDGMFVGVICGMATNAVVWQYTDWSWLWWSPIGFVVTTGTAGVISLVNVIAANQWERIRPLFRLEKGRHKTDWIPWYVLCVVYFFVIIGICAGIESALT